MRLTVSGAATAELPLRVLNLLAQHGASVDRGGFERADKGYRLSFDIDPMSPERAAPMVEKIRAMILVTDAEIVGDQAAASPCRLISESISPSSELEHTPSTSASSQPSATT